MIHTVDGSHVSDLLQRIGAEPRRYASVVVCSPYIDTAFVPHLIDLADNTWRAQCGLRIVTSPTTAALLRASLPVALSRAVISHVGLHAKVYLLVGRRGLAESEAIVTSANLTNCGTNKNIEFGVHAKSTSSSGCTLVTEVDEFIKRLVA